MRLDTSLIHQRSNRLINSIIALLQLDLSGATVLTEMASSHFIYTPFIAATAGADKVITVTKDSRYGKAKDIIAQGTRLAADWELSQIHCTTELTPELIAEADIVTNLGFVRPITTAFVAHMKPGAVIPYMCEAWEFRPGDVDLHACQHHGVPVMGTFEGYLNLNIFEYCGPLLGKLLFEAGLEIMGNRFLLLSSDPFGRTLSSYLEQNDAVVVLVQSRHGMEGIRMDGLDGLIVADQRSDEVLVGTEGWVEPGKLASASPGAIVLQYAGIVDVTSVELAGLACIPKWSIGAHRMWQTLAYLGPRPIIDLHALGLKVGELMWRRMQVVHDSKRVEEELAREYPLCQHLSEGA